MNKHLFAIFVFLALSVAFTVAVAQLYDNQSEKPGELPDVLWAPSSPLSAELVFTQISDSEGKITLTISATDFFEASGARAEITLPDGIVNIDGDLEWSGVIHKGSETQITVGIRAARDGSWVIKGSVIAGDPDGEFVGETDYLYIDVADSSIIYLGQQPYYDGKSKLAEVVTDISLIKKSELATVPGEDRVAPRPTDISEASDRPLPDIPSGSPAESAVSSGDNVGGNLTVTGCWLYWDDNDVQRPLIWATVNIYDEDTTGLVFLESGLTGTDGCFSVGPIENNDGLLQGGLDIRVRIIASSGAAMVIDPAGNVYDSYTPSGSFDNTQDGTLDVGNWSVPTGEKWAWTIFSYEGGLLAGWNYFKNMGPGFDVQQVVARYPFEAWEHYHITGFYAQEIHIPNIDVARSPDVILHEYGHHVMWYAYGGAFPTSFCPDPHYFSRISHVNYAWTEGWANIVPLVVLDDPVYTRRNRFSVNLETPDRQTLNWDDGDAVEGRVAGALWDIYDASPDYDDGYDKFGEGFLEIWNPFERQNDNNFSQFWAEYQTGKPDVSPQLLALYQNSIDYIPSAPAYTLAWTNPPTSVPVGETFRMEFTISDLTSSAGHGGVSVSLPTLTATHGGPGSCYDSSQGSVSIVSYTTGASPVTCYDEGDSIWNSASVQFPAEHMLVESDDPTWPSVAIRTLVLDITPRVVGSFAIKFRGWLCALEYLSCSRSPAPIDSEGIDQQGFNIKSLTVNVIVTPVPSFNLQLVEEWNLVSFPVNNIGTKTVSEVVASLGNNLVRVYEYDPATPGNPWKIYDPNAPPFVNTLSSLSPELGYWLLLSTGDNLAVTGNILPVDNTSWGIVAGWQLVGWGSDTSGNPAGIAGALGGTVRIYGYDPQSTLSPWKLYDSTTPPIAQTLSQLVRGYGYWLYWQPT